jgi:glycosyltransferase involved in cell wall biosynthesis
MDDPAGSVLGKDAYAIPMAVAVLPRPPKPLTAPPPALVAPISGARGRRVVVLAAHHVCVDRLTLTGGAEKYVLTVIQSLLDAGAEVHVGYSGTSIYKDLLEQYDPRRLTVERTGWLNDVLSGDRSMTPALVRKRRRWFRATGADTVFAVQQAGGGAFAASLLAARTMSLRVVASLRQEPSTLPPTSADRWLGFLPAPHLWRRRPIWRRRLAAKWCDVLIYNSHHVAAAYQSQLGFPAHKTRVIYNGELPGEWRPSRVPRNIAAVGRVTEAKGADLLFEAFTNVARRNPASHLTYYGEGPLASALAARAEAHGLADRVTFAGYRADREAIFRNTDLCVQMSRRESMSNSVVEAMARGIPCVVADVGGLPETVAHGQSGYVVPPGDSAACADAICDLLGDRERYTRFARASIDRARRLFDLHRLMRQTVEAILGIGAEA